MAKLSRLTSHDPSADVRISTLITLKKPSRIFQNIIVTNQTVYLKENISQPIYQGQPLMVRL